MLDKVGGGGLDDWEVKIADFVVLLGKDGKKVPDTNGGSLRSRSTASEQPMFDFGFKMQFSFVKMGKIRLEAPPFVPDTLGLPQSWTLDSGNLTLLSLFAEYFCHGLGQPI